MSETVLDCQGMPCPQPVILVKRHLESGARGGLAVLVDNEPAVENVTRFLGSQGHAGSCVQEGAAWRIVADLDAGAGAPAEIVCPAPAGASGAEGKTLVMLIAPVFGSGDDGLGGRLMKNFLATLPEMGDSLWRIVMLNGGVTLAVEDSPVIGELRRLEAAGVSILVCGTCLEHFGLLAKKAVGQTTNMLDVVTSMQLADKVIRA